uniref:Uncharacterized protein n=1 Tax=mine drainage metagenome TaxID=410659 RepID=E6QXE7_9ZZZZ
MAYSLVFSHRAFPKLNPLGAKLSVFFEFVGVSSGKGFYNASLELANNSLIHPAQATEFGIGSYAKFAFHNSDAFWNCWFHHLYIINKFK